jgi:hypothetical protein
LLLDISAQKFLQEQLRVREPTVVKVGCPPTGDAQDQAIDTDAEPVLAVHPLPNVERFVREHGPAFLPHRLGRISGLEARVTELDACRHWLPTQSAEWVPSPGDAQALEV